MLALAFTFRKLAIKKKLAIKRLLYFLCGPVTLLSLCSSLAFIALKCSQFFFSVDTKIHKRALGRLIWWFPGLEEIPQQLPRFFVN